MPAGFHHAAAEAVPDSVLYAKKLNPHLRPEDDGEVQFITQSLFGIHAVVGIS